MTRPAPPKPVSGFEWYPFREPVEEWTTLHWHVGDKRCRHADRPRGRCPNLVAAVLFRGHRRRPYGYCGDHLYGRWIDGGAVWGWRLRRADGLTGGRALLAGRP